MAEQAPGAASQRGGRRASVPEERPAGAAADVLLRRIIVVESGRSTALIAELAAAGIQARAVAAASLTTMIAGLIVFETDETLAQVTEAVQTLRRRHATVGALALLSADADPAGVLEHAADATLPAAASGDTIVAQLRALARMLAADPPSDEPEIIMIRNMTVDLDRREVRANGRTLGLTPTEFRILAQLARRPGRVVSHADIFREVHGYTIADQEAKDILKVHIWRLRSKLAAVVPDANLIVNVRGFGYLLERRIRDRRAREAATEEGDPS